MISVTAAVASGPLYQLSWELVLGRSLSRFRHTHVLRPIAGSRIQEGRTDLFSLPVGWFPEESWCFSQMLGHVFFVLFWRRFQLARLAGSPVRPDGPRAQRGGVRWAGGRRGTPGTWRRCPTPRTSSRRRAGRRSWHTRPEAQWRGLRGCFPD